MYNKIDVWMRCNVNMKLCTVTKVLGPLAKTVLRIWTLMIHGLRENTVLLGKFQNRY